MPVLGPDLERSLQVGQRTPRFLCDSVGVATQNAYNDSTYRVLVNTISDSSSSSDGVYDYRVIANMEEGNFVSETATGYSVDNIAPSVPEGLLATSSAGGLILTWQPNSEEDFQYYGIYRSTESDFSPELMDLYTYATSCYIGTNFSYLINSYKLFVRTNINNLFI